MRVLILGEGKSGTTALMRSIATAIGDPSELFEPKQLRPEDLEADPLVVKKLLFGWKKPDAELAGHFDKRLFIMRDPRDRLISHLLYDAYNAAPTLDATQRSQWINVLAAKTANPSDFAFSELLHQWWQITGRDLLSHHVRAIDRTRNFFRRQSESFFLLRYEDYVDGKFAEVDTYLGLELAAGVVATDESRVARSGSHGDWRLWFTEKDLPVFQAMTSIGLEAQGYDAHDWELSPAHTIDSTASIEYVQGLFEQVPASNP